MNTDIQIAQILLKAGVIDDMQLRSVQARQQQWGGRIHHIIAENGFAPEASIAQALADHLNMPRVALADLSIDQPTLAKLNAAFCEEHSIFPCALRDDGKTLWITMSDPLDLGAFDQVRSKVRVARVNAGVSGHQEILDAINQYYRGRRNMSPKGFQRRGGMSVDLEDQGEEFKIQDASGSTKVKHDPAAVQLRAELANAPRSESGVFTRQTFAESPPQQPDHTAGPEIAALLAKLERHHGRSNKILRAMIGLCVQKGLFTSEEFRSKSTTTDQ